MSDNDELLDEISSQLEEEHPTLTKTVPMRHIYMVAGRHVTKDGFIYEDAVPRTFPIGMVAEDYLTAKRYDAERAEIGAYFPAGITRPVNYYSKRVPLH